MILLSELFDTQTAPKAGWLLWLVGGLLVWLCAVTTAHALLLPLGMYEHGMVYLDDAAPVEREGAQVRVWSVTDYREPQKHHAGKTYRSSRSWLAVDCANQRARIMHLTFFAGPRASGAVVERQGLLHDWLPVVRGTPLQKVLDRYCP